MTDPLDKIKEWRKITDAATPGEMHHGGSVTKQFTDTSRTAMPLLLTAVESVFKLEPCGRHDCGCGGALFEVREAVRDALGGAQ